MFGNITAVLPLVREGKLRALAVTSPRRWASVPDLPTMIEAGLHGLRLDRVVRPDGAGRDAAADHRQDPSGDACASWRVPDVRKRFDELGMEAIGNTPAEFAAVIAAETPQWAKVIKDAGVKASDPADSLTRALRCDDRNVRRRVARHRAG